MQDFLEMMGLEEEADKPFRIKTHYPGKHLVLAFLAFKLSAEDHS